MAAGFNGSGTYARAYDWTNDRDAGVKIRADRMDEEMDAFATGLSTALCKDGQSTPTANLPMGGYKFTGLGAGSAAGNSVRWEQVLGNTISPSQITADQDDYAPSGYATASIMRLDVDAAHNITGLNAGIGTGGVVLVNTNGTYTITLKDASSSSTAANRFAFGADFALSPGASISLFYDATSARWRMRTTLGSPILQAIGALASNGAITRTASGTVAARTMTGTSGKITVTNGDGVSGDPTFNVGSSVALLDSAGQTLSGGARVTTYDNGTKSSGTLTPDPGNGPTQKYTNGGAHALAPGTNYGSYILDITNNGSAGSITTSFTKVTGSSFTTTNGHKFKCYAHISELGSLLNVQAMQ